MVSGESHYFAARQYHLHVYATNGPDKVAITKNTNIELHVLRDTNVDTRWRRHVRMADIGFQYF